MWSEHYDEALAAMKRGDPPSDSLLSGLEMGVVSGRELGLAHCACQIGDPAWVKATLGGYDERDKTDRGFKPVHYAAEKGHRDALKVLIEHDPKVMKQETLDSKTPFMIGAINGHYLDELFHAKTTCITNSNRESVLHEAYNAGHLDVAEKVISPPEIEYASKSRDQYLIRFVRDHLYLVEMSREEHKSTREELWKKVQKETSRLKDLQEEQDLTTSCLLSSLNSLYDKLHNGNPRAWCWKARGLLRRLEETQQRITGQLKWELERAERQCNVQRKRSRPDPDIE